MVECLCSTGGKGHVTIPVTAMGPEEYCVVLLLLRTSSGMSLWTGIITIHIGTRLKWGLPFWDPSGSLLYASGLTDLTDGGL